MTLTFWPTFDEVAKFNICKLLSGSICVNCPYRNMVIDFYESLEGPLLKKENIFYLVITRKLTRNNEITNLL